MFIAKTIRRKFKKIKNYFNILSNKSKTLNAGRIWIGRLRNLEVRMQKRFIIKVKTRIKFFLKKLEVTKRGKRGN